MSNITEERLAMLIRKLDATGEGGYVSRLDEMRDGLRELQLLRASAPVLSEEQRAALLRAAQMFVDDATEFGEHKYYEKGMAQAALLRAMAERGASDSASPQTPATSPDGLR